jgi:hypothetical protein
MFRRKVGLIAIGLLAVGGLLLLVRADGATIEGLRGACLSVGVGMALLWLAEPQLRQVPFWLPISIAIVTGVLMFRPKLIPLGLAAVAVLWLIRPRRTK